MSLLPPAYLSKKLTQPLPTKGGAVLRTIGEAANYLALFYDCQLDIGAMG
jgi:hypothetical protein